MVIRKARFLVWWLIILLIAGAIAAFFMAGSVGLQIYGIGIFLTGTCRDAFDALENSCRQEGG
ncbi:hypothetical protein AA103196_1003 [Ameyamaea chiangmaiensis NBRC 103196]|nr:hypothetical protein AA103196_1003 [Ameyamaea chiangmaiensis NBRC 103196]